ncbi:MAG TPA: hypothetical protein VFN99_10230 [Gaiella sp.]|nr:hypothetical protein [Gaiella sp.]
MRRSLIPPLVDARLEVNDVDGLAELVGELDRGDERDRATAAALRALVDPAFGGSRSFAELEADVDAAQPVLERASDWMGMARCERARAQLAWAECQATKSHRAMRRCLEYLHRAGSTAWQADLMTHIPASAVFSGVPQDEVAAIIRELEREATDAGPLLESTLRAARARLDCLAGVLEIDDARAIVLEYRNLLRQIGSELEAEVSSGILAQFAWFEGPEEHEQHVRKRVERFEALGDRKFLANVLADWASGLCGVGKADEALTAVSRGRAIAREDDVADEVGLNMAEAWARALLGERERAELLIDRTHEALRDVDMTLVVDWACRIEASARAALGDIDDARSILLRLVADAERRGFVRYVDVYRRELAALDASSPD